MSEQEKSTSWEAATVDQNVTEQVAQYEQQFHQSRAASNAKREANAEQVEWVESVDVTDRGEPTVSRGRQDYDNAQNGEDLEPELAEGVEVQEIEAEAAQDAGVPQSEAVQEGSSRLESIREQLGLNSQPQQEVSRLDAIQATLTSSPQEIER